MIALNNPLSSKSRQLVSALPYLEILENLQDSSILWKDESEPESINIYSSHILNHQIRHEKNKERKLLMPQKYVACLKGASLYGTAGFIQLDNGYFLRDTYWNNSQLHESPRSSRLGKIFHNYLRGNWFSMLLYYSSGYYHWFCDVLPRLFVIKNYLPEDTKFIIQKKAPPWMIESLGLMGISLEQCYEFDGKIPLRLEHLYFTPPLAVTGCHDPLALRWVRDKLLNVVSPEHLEKPSLRLYISRASAKRRCIVNENKLIDKLKPYNFRVVGAEKLTLREQIKLFSKAEWVVGPHGAGFTNLIFSQPGTSLLEIFEPSTTQRPCYHYMSQTLNHSYHNVLGETRENLDDEPNIYLSDSRIREILDIIKSKAT